MKSFGHRRYALSVGVGVALLAGCGGSQPPIGAPGAMPRSLAIATHAGRGRSWMLPEAKRLKKLLYVSDWDADDVEVYNYETGAEVGTLTGFNSPDGQCVDKSGDIWITNLLQDYIVEYAHGGKGPVKTLSTNGPGVGCAIDPTTGSLAVVNFRAGTGSDIQIWKNAVGTPTNYQNDNDCYEMWAPGYDRRGNLYAESGNPDSACELPANGASLGGVPFDHLINTPGGVMWDGKYLAFTDQGYEGGRATAIYRVKQARGRLVAVGRTVLRRSPCGAVVAQPFIVGKKNTPANEQLGTVVVGGNLACYYTSPVEYWHYPGGGHPFEHVSAGVKVTHPAG